MLSMTKKPGCITLLALIMLGVAPVYAENAATTAQDNAVPGWQKTCKTYAVWGEAAMQAHQQGVKLDRVFERANQPVFDGIRKHLLKIAIDAYETPLTASEQEQSKVRREFYNDVYLQCAKQHLHSD